jgi:small multidrug resistance pump
MAYLYLALAFCLNAAGNILLKEGAAHPIAVSNWQLILGLILFAANAGFYVLAIKTLPLSVAYPTMVAMSFLIVLTYAYFKLGESLGWLNLFGFLLIIVGVILAVSRS